MTLPIPPVAPPIAPKPVTPSQAAESIPDSIQGLTSPATTGDVGGGFAQAVTDALDNVSGLENRVDEAGRLAATGDLNSVSDYMIATAEAQLATEITVAIRDRAIAAFNDIMTMQI